MHRDLKPANIMITASGAKVLDFGVARMAQDEETPFGPVAGTAAYMSPSQWNGNPADARSDIFTLGLVLYEMLTGTRPTPTPKPHQRARGFGEPRRPLFAAGRRQPGAAYGRGAARFSSTFAFANRHGEAGQNWARPDRTAALLTVAAAAALLTWNLMRPGPLPPKPSPAAKPPISDYHSPAPGTQATRSTAPPATPPEARPTRPVAPPAPLVPPSLAALTSDSGMERDPSFSPDGSRVAFSAHRRNRNGYGIYVRPVQWDGPSISLTDKGVEDWGPAWSPDGRTIAFRREGGPSGIYSVPASGGEASLVAPIARQRQETLPQMSWSHDGKWIAAPDRDSSGATRIYLFAPESGEKRQITSNPAGTDHAPAFSPDGKSLAYASCRAAVYPCDVWVLDLGKDSVPKQARPITHQGVYIRGIAWLPNGKGLVYSAGWSVSTETSLWRVSVNPPGLPERIEIAGSQARHPATSMAGGYLAYTGFKNWKLMMIQHFR